MQKNSKGNDFIRMLPLIIGIVVVSFTGSCGRGQESGGKFERRVLDNGFVVLAQEVDGINRMGMELFYKNGFMQDGQGFPQQAHLAEHLFSKGRTQNFKVGQSWEVILTRGGKTNAETMPGFTHFDYGVPLLGFGLPVQIEIERMQSLGFDEKLIEGERQFCYEEFRHVENQPTAPVIKFAMMAANQIWRYGAKEVKIGSALDDVTSITMIEYIRSHYAPGSAIIAITGGGELEKTVGYVSEQFSRLAPREIEPRTAIDWDAQPNQSEAIWDSKTNGIFVWFAPPEDPSERTILSIWASDLVRRLAADQYVKEIARYVMGTSYTWPVGEMPFFVYMTTREGVNLDTALKTFGERVDQAIAEARMEAAPSSVQLVMQDLGNLGTLTTQQVAGQVAFLAGKHEISQQDALEEALLLHSLNLGIREMLFGADFDTQMAKVQNLTGQELADLISRVLAPANRRTTLLRAANTD